jgi:hypothetical protein
MDKDMNTADTPLQAEKPLDKRTEKPHKGSTLSGEALFGQGEGGPIDNLDEPQSGLTKGSTIHHDIHGRVILEGSLAVEFMKSRKWNHRRRVYFISGIVALVIAFVLIPLTAPGHNVAISISQTLSVMGILLLFLSFYYAPHIKKLGDDKLQVF